MATINGVRTDKVYSIPKWLGMNEHPDGDTRLKLGEAARMVNWKITRDGNLKRRPGLEFFAGLNEDYTISISDDVVLISDELKATDVVQAYTAATAMAPPGTVTMIGAAGVVEKGKYRISLASVADGVLSGVSPLTFATAKGVLSAAGASDRATMTQLADMLAELEDGEWLYIVYDEQPYALRNDSLIVRNGMYILSGYEMSAVVDGGTAMPVAGMWAGIAGGKLTLLAACDGKIWSLYDADTDTVTRSSVGDIDTDKGVNFIPFENKVYIQNGKEYYVWDGITLDTVTGYVPLIATAIGPTASADAGELTGYNVNLLTPKRRVWLSPDGDVNKTFKLPEIAKTVNSVKYLDESADPTYDFTTGTDTITFTSTLAAAVNSIEVEYSVNTHEDDSDIPDYRAQVTGYRFCEIFSGNTDSALFFYGNGTNKVIYTGMDYDGMPRADYFPDTYEVAIGDSNTPVTSLIRHYAVLLAFKTDSTWALSYGTSELATGDLTTAVYVTPVNRDKGNDAYGQVRLVNNNPVTCSGSELYQWSNTSYYTSALSRDERQAKRISDRIQRSIKEIDFKHCCMWDDNDGQEFYISGNGVTLVWNYVTDTWYRYEGLDAVMMCNFQGDVIIGTSGGKIFRLTYMKDTDDGVPVRAVWESGAMDFGAPSYRKYSDAMWVGLKPVDGTSVNITVITDRKDTFKDKVVSSSRAKVNGQPFMVKTKIKAKKFVYYRIVLTIDRKMGATVVTDLETRARITGDAK
jgi:hypothetical protein